MNEDKLHLLTSQAELMNKLDAMTEAFTDYYGEARRSEIEKCFRSLLIIKYTAPNSFRVKIEKYKSAVFNELYGAIVSSWHVDNFIRDLYAKKLPDSDKLSSAPFSTVVKIILGDNYGSAEKVFNDFIMGKYPKLDELIDRIKEADDYDKLLDKYDTIAAKINEKYYTKLLTEFSYLIPSEEIKEYHETGIVGSVMRSYFDTSIYPCRHPFDETSEAVLHNPTSTPHKRKTITDSRLEFLSINGYEYNSYEDALNDPKCTLFIKKTMEVCHKIQEKKSELYCNQEQERITSYFDYQACEQLITRKHTVFSFLCFNPHIYNLYGTSLYEANYTFEDGKYISSPLLLINSEAHDHSIIHELNHALEYHTISVNKEGYTGITGWDYEEVNVGKTEEETGRRKYELISEYINDVISTEIEDKMHEKGIYIIDMIPEGKSNYMALDFLLKDFYQEFKEIIIESRSHGNIKYLLDYIGKDNFEALNDLVNKYDKEMGLGRVISAIQSSTVVQTKDYIEAMQQILANMREYSQVTKRNK